MTKQLLKPLLGVKKQHTCVLPESCYYNNALAPSAKKKQSVVAVCDLPRCCNYVSGPSRYYCCHDHALEGNFMGGGFFDDDTDCLSYHENLGEQAIINEGDDDAQVDTHTNHHDTTTDSLSNKKTLGRASIRRTIMTDATRDMLLSIRSVKGAIAALASKFKPKKGRVGTWPSPPPTCRSK